MSAADALDFDEGIEVTEITGADAVALLFNLFGVRLS